jgi:hypothetical protein
MTLPSLLPFISVSAKIKEWVFFGISGIKQKKLKMINYDKPKKILRTDE